MIANKYKIIEKISQGSFGKVFNAKNIRTNENVAIKIEPKTIGLTSLKNEAKIYQYLSGVNGFPKLKLFGTTDTFNYLIMDLLGLPLGSQTKMSYVEIGTQIIMRVKSLHEMLLLHRDIKPANFLFGTEEQTNKLYLIDVGFSKKYINNGKHILQKNITKIIGSPNFVSLNIHNLIEPSRRDDIESCIYVILTMFLNGQLEWFHKTNINEIYELKKNITYNSCVPNFIKKMLTYVRSLGFEEQPNYEYLIQLLND
jgi:casein kinase 1